MRFVGVTPDEFRALAHASAPGSSWGVSPGAAARAFFVGTSVIRTPHDSKHLNGWRGRKHRPGYTPQRADRPVSEGPEKVQGQVVRQTLYRKNRYVLRALGYRNYLCSRAREDSPVLSPLGRFLCVNFREEES